MTKIYMAKVTQLLNDVAFCTGLKTVSEFRRKKVTRLKHRSDKNLSLGAGLILEYGLKCFLGICKNVDISISENGKPYLKNYPNIHFSLSHSGDMAICAISDNPVGVDIQVCTDFKDEICRRYFKKCEADYVFGAKIPAEKKERFFRIWTLKEAYSKMTGKGLGSFRDFGFDIKDGIIFFSDTAMLPLSFFEYDIPGCKTSLCICGEEEKPKINNVNIYDLLIN